MRYVLGLDIGIASVGWAVLALDGNDEPYKIVDLNSRIFTRAEQPKTGASLALPRREARGTRRRLRRRRHRLDRIIHLFNRSGMGSNAELKDMVAATDEDVYALRMQGLESLLNKKQWIKVLYHIAKHRGFKSNRKNADKASEDGKVLEAVKENNEILNQYRTVGEMVFMNDKFTDRKRNTTDSYIMTISRDKLQDEIVQLFEKQRAFGNEFSSKALEDEYTSIFISQRSFAEGPGKPSIYGGDQIEKMIGICTLEREAKEKRAPKASYAFMRFSLLQKINNIVLVENYKERKLTEDERASVEALAWRSPSVTLESVRKELKLPISILFKEVRYPNIEDGEDVAKSIASAEKKIKFSFVTPYHDMRKALKDISKDYIETLSHAQLDNIAYAFSVFRTDDSLRQYLEAKEIPAEAIDALVAKLKNFSKFGHLSLKASYKLIPFLEQGYTYDKACEAAGYDFKGHKGEKSMLLSSDCDEIKEIPNPVVKRAVTQTIKVINAIVRKYGSPVEVHVELAREMGRTKADRDKLNKSMKDNQARNELIKKKLMETYNVYQPTGQQILALKLLEEQNFRCAYSLKPLDADRVFHDNNYAQIDHIIPYSRSFDDSFTNKVIVLTEENQKKSNNIPMKYLADNPAKQSEYVAWVNTNIRDRRKKHNLLLEEYTAQMANDWKERNLNDTKYISRLMHNFLRDHLLLAEGKRKRRIIAVNGVVTSYIRKRLGINKIRENGDLHHAVDAAVIACITDGVVNKVTRYSKWKEVLFGRSKDGRIVDYETGEIIDRDSFDEHFKERFPEPWEKFRQELAARVSNNPAEAIRYLRLLTYSEAEIEALKPIFVSRMPRRTVKGEAHEATILSPRLKEQGMVLKKVALNKLKLSKDGNEIEGYYNPDSDRLLYNALLKRLQDFGGKGEKAFPEDDEFHKPKADGTIGPVVKKVKLMEKSTMNVAVNGGKGLAANGKMVRVDVFYISEGKDRGYYLVPIYVADAVKDELPNKAIVQGKTYEQWKVMSDDDFLFSLYPNDLVYIESKNGIKLSNKNKDNSEILKEMQLKRSYFYYNSTNIATAQIKIITHDGVYEQTSLGCKTLISMKKSVVDMLGNVSLVGREKRRSLKCR